MNDRDYKIGFFILTIFLMVSMFLNAAMMGEVRQLKQSTADAWHFLQKYEDLYVNRSITFNPVSPTNAFAYFQWKAKPDPHVIVPPSLTNTVFFERMYIDVSTQYQDAAMSDGSINEGTLKRLLTNHWKNALTAHTNSGTPKP